jgi:hypothetical protein
LSDAGRKAHKLALRGVRRVFVADVERQRAFEWSEELMGWRMLEHDGAIEDPTLAAPLPIEALVRAAKADDAMAHALLAKRNPVLEAALAQYKAEGKAEGKAEAILAVLKARGLTASAAQRARIQACKDVPELDRWLRLAATAATVDALFSP